MAVVPRHTHAFTDIVGGAGTGGGSGGDLAAERAQRIAADAALEAAKVNRVGDDRVTGQLRVGQSKVDDQAEADAPQRMVAADEDGVQVVHDPAYVVPGVPDVDLGGGGTLWLRTTISPSRLWYGVAEGNGIMVAIAGDLTGNNVGISSDGGVTWTFGVVNSIRKQWRAIAFGYGRFVIVANSGDYSGNPSRIMWSVDGVTWNEGLGLTNTPGSEYYIDVIYASSIGKFVAINTNGGITHSVALSTDGASWEYGSTDLNSSIGLSLAAGDGIFLTGSSNGNIYFRSTNGYEWFHHDAPWSNHATSSIAYGGGVFMIVTQYGVIWTTTDGISWTQRATLAAATGAKLRYGAGRFIAAILSFSTTARYVSTDFGVTWTAASTALFLGYALLHSPGYGRFVNLGTEGADRSTDNFIPGQPGKFRFEEKVQVGSLQIDDTAGPNTTRLLVTNTDGDVSAPLEIVHTAPNPATSTPGRLDFGPLYGVRLLDEAGAANPLAAFVQPDGQVQANENLSFVAGVAATIPWAVIPCEGSLADVMGHMTVTAAPSLSSMYWHYASTTWGEPMEGGWLICDYHLDDPTPPAMLPAVDVSGSYGVTLSTASGASISVKIFVKPITTGGQIPFHASYGFGIFSISVGDTNIRVLDGGGDELWQTALPPAGDPGRYMTIAYAKVGLYYVVYVDGVAVSIDTPGTHTGLEFRAAFVQDSDLMTTQYGAHGFCELVVWTSAPNEVALRAAREREYRTGVTADAIDTLTLADRTNLRIPDLAGTPADTPQSRLLRSSLDGTIEPHPTPTGVAGTYGGATHSAVITVDQYGIVVGASEEAIAGGVASHASTHASGGSDPLKLDDLAAPDDNTDLDASTAKHGLLKKLGGGTANFLRADGTWAPPPGGAGGGGAAVDITATPASNNPGTNVQAQLDNINDAISNVFFMGRLLNLALIPSTLAYTVFAAPTPAFIPLPTLSTLAYTVFSVPSPAFIPGFNTIAL